MPSTTELDESQQWHSEQRQSQQPQLQQPLAIDPDPPQKTQYAIVLPRSPKEFPLPSTPRRSVSGKIDITPKLMRYVVYMHTCLLWAMEKLQATGKAVSVVLSWIVGTVVGLFSNAFSISWWGKVEGMMAYSCKATNWMSLQERHETHPIISIGL